MEKFTMQARISPNMDPDVVEFLTKYVDTFIKWELLRFFHENPHTFDTAENIARYIGRGAAEVQRALVELKHHGLFQETSTGNLLTYSLHPTPELEADLEDFIKATNDREFRRKAIYHLIH